MSGRVKGSAFLVVERNYQNPARLRPIRVTARYPRTLDVEQTVIALRLDVPASAFDALQAPEVVVPEMETAAEVTPA